MWSPRVPKVAKREPKWLPFGSIFSHNFRFCVNLVPQRLGTWPQGAPGSQNDAKMLQKVTPVASKTSKMSPQGAQGPPPGPKPGKQNEH